jgi:hypothetical protein
MLRLSPIASVEELTRELGPNAKGEQVRISNRMEAHLEGLGFRIQPLQEESQAISSLQSTTWEWQVEPTATGSYPLKLTLSALIEVSGHDTPILVRSLDRTISVDVTLGGQVKDFVSSNWQWLWAAILVPLGGFLWRRRTSKQRR